MSTYKMVSNDYPQNTFVILRCEGGANNRGFVVHMPLPNQLAYQTGFNWSTENVPLVAQTLIDNYSGKGSISRDDTESSLMSGVETVLAQSMDSMKKMLIKSVSGLTTGGTAAGQYFLKSKYGVTYNPNKQLFFTGIDNRQLNVSFDIIAQNKQQADTCAQAIKAIRVASSPSYSASKSFFEYPSYFSMKAVVNGSVVMQYNKFAITAINTNLSPNGVMSWHPDGKPVAYTLEISGIETDIATSDVERSRSFLGA